MGTILLILLALLAVVFATMLGALQTTLISVTKHEVRHRTRRKEKGAKSLFLLQARGYEVIVSFILLRMLMSVLVISIMIVLLPLFLSVLAATLLLTLTTEIVGRFFLRGFVLRQTDWLMPVLDKLILLTLPLSRPVGRWLDRRLANRLPVIHSKQQLLEILDEHKTSPYSDIEAEQIEIAKHALTFGDRAIREVMTPKSAVISVSADTAVGPVIMDELHKSGHSRFPVWSSREDNIVGTLFLQKLVDLKDSHGKIKDYASKKVYFVHEELPLGHVLQAFIKTKHHLFVVVNNFEEYVGIITLEDVIEQIIGRQVVDEFDEYENLREVVALRSKKAHAKNDHPV